MLEFPARSLILVLGLLLMFGVLQEHAAVEESALAYSNYYHAGETLGCDQLPKLGATVARDFVQLHHAGVRSTAQSLFFASPGAAAGGAASAALGEALTELQLLSDAHALRYTLSASDADQRACLHDAYAGFARGMNVGFDGDPQCGCVLVEARDALPEQGGPPRVFCLCCQLFLPFGLIANDYMLYAIKRTGAHFVCAHFFNGRRSCARLWPAKHLDAKAGVDALHIRRLHTSSAQENSEPQPLLLSVCGANAFAYSATANGFEVFHFAIDAGQLRFVKKLTLEGVAKLTVPSVLTAAPAFEVICQNSQGVEAIVRIDTLSDGVAATQLDMGFFL